MRVGEAAHDSTVALAPGETLELCLPETPTTGYHWEVIADGSPACAIAGNARVAPSSSMRGGGGERCWTVTAVHAGTGEIELQRRRSWEASAEPGRVFRLHVRVEHAQR
ncbi:MAG TPA: protease inhibitor I42 family protein [Stellaceae bacterium]|nr:protease inhibitor I42 family protein [Stellaceae bacterium]